MTRPELPRLQADEPGEAILEALDEAGGVIVEGMLSGAQAQAVIDEVAPFVAAADVNMQHVNEGVQWFFRGVRNVTGLAGKSPTFVEAMLLNPVMLGLADGVLLPHCSNYKLNVGHLLAREPGAERQLPHRDSDVWIHLAHLVESMEPRPRFTLSSVTALTDFTEGNGATVVVPGSHRWERARQPEEHQFVCAEMPAGSTVVYHGETIHAGGTNSTDADRFGIHMSYVVGWLRSEENNVLATPPDVARTLPPAAQRVLGYECHDAIELAGGYLGVVDLRDPAAMLAAGEL